MSAWKIIGVQSTNGVPRLGFPKRIPRKMIPEEATRIIELSSSSDEESSEVVDLVSDDGDVSDDGEVSDDDVINEDGEKQQQEATNPTYGNHNGTTPTTNNIERRCLDPSV